MSLLSLAAAVIVGAAVLSALLEVGAWSPPPEEIPDAAVSFYGQWRGSDGVWRTYVATLDEADISAEYQSRVTGQ